MKKNEELCDDGSKLLGYPCFVQFDPRDEDDPCGVLLLQLDSNDSPTERGDAGIANFFINSQALKREAFPTFCTTGTAGEQKKKARGFS